MQPTFNPFQSQIESLDQRIAENQLLIGDPELSELAQEEISRLEAEKKILLDASSAYESSSQSSGSVEESPKNCIIEIRGGAGGDEAKLWASDLLRMYLRFAEIAGLKVEYIDDLVIKFKGRTQLFGADLMYPYELLKYESGVHRVQRVPATEAQGRIHTSTASVAVLPEVHTTAVVIREEDLEWQFMRSSGAGGQSVNKTSSAVRLIHGPSGIVTTARQEKKQEQNRKIALELLRSQLWEIQEEERLKTIGDARSVIGRNRRSEKIRTYNFPQNRVTDHRIKESWHNLDAILEGDLVDVLTKTHQILDAGTEVSGDSSEGIED